MEMCPSYWPWGRGGVEQLPSVGILGSGTSDRQAHNSLERPYHLHPFVLLGIPPSVLCNKATLSVSLDVILTPSTFQGRISEDHIDDGSGYFLNVHEERCTFYSAQQVALQGCYTLTLWSLHLISSTQAE